MSKTKKSREDFKKEDILQAVVIADSFNVRFAPITHAKPRTLLPLVNVPLLAYTLECLDTSGIQEVIVFCCIHADQIKEYINASKWGPGAHSTMDVQVVVSEGCMSVGDALRDIDANSLINNDFVLINGDMVSNVNLKPLLEAHKQRRLRDKTPIMTMLFKKAPPNHATRCKEEDVVMAIEKTKEQVLSYQKVATQSKFLFPVELFDGRSDVCLRFDLLDTHISICSPRVPQLFTDEFDYLSRDDFVKGILVNEEITGNTIHIHILEEEYAARVSSLHMYDSVSKDVLSRWSYPMVPDKTITENADDQYSLRRHNIYLHKDVVLARGCILQENVTIAKGSTVGCNTKISHSVIGKNVTIGENVVIHGSYLWDGCTVGNGCILSTCVLDTGVHIKDKVTIKKGCVIAKEVVVGPCVTLSSCTYLTSTHPDLDEDFADDETPLTQTVDPNLIGAEGRGFLYEQNVDSDTDDDSAALHQGSAVSALWGQSPGESEEEVTTDSGTNGSGDSGEELADDDQGMEAEEGEDSDLFFEEVSGVLERGLTENIGADNLVLEINSAKSAYGIYIKEVNLLLTKAIIELPLTMYPDLSSPAQYLTHLIQNFKYLKPLLENYIRSEESQRDCLSSIEDVCNNSSLVLKSMAKLLHHLYDELEILSEEVILSWYKAPPSEGKENKRPVQQDAQVAKFIQWLEEDEESDEDS